ncbi:MAG: DUF4355 domain-containing protein [Firmicutes bacterium]|nr:DUF4355 domain-containing protein [Bacillota bacterium]
MDEKKKQGTQKNNIPKTYEGHKNDEGHKNGELKALIADYVAEALKGEKALWDKELKERIASEREDAAKMASMSSEERARVEMERRQKDFETERQQYMSERAEFEAAKELAAQELPVSFAKMVADPDREVTAENISVFKSEYMKAIENGLSNRLKGALPRISKEKEPMGDPFLNGLGM